MNCKAPMLPETCSVGLPLTWVRDSAAVKIYRVRGNGLGTPTFDVKDWKTGTGGSWEHWWVSNGVLNTGAGSAPVCTTATSGGRSIDAQREDVVIVSPNPGASRFLVEGKAGTVVRMFSFTGLLVGRVSLSANGEAVVDAEAWPAGAYAIVSDSGARAVWVKR